MEEGEDAAAPEGEGEVKDQQPLASVFSSFDTLYLPLSARKGDRWAEPNSIFGDGGFETQAHRAPGTIGGRLENGVTTAKGHRGGGVGLTHTAPVL